MIRSKGSYSGHTTDAILALHRRTLYRTVGTKNAAVTRLWLEHLATPGAAVEVPAGVLGHLLAGFGPAQRALDGGCERDRRHRFESSPRRVGCLLPGGRLRVAGHPNGYIS